MKKLNIQNEQGRSMVEMLGVLAIIGVLSVGGIAGYTSAMNKHRANETVDCLMKRAIIVSGQRLLGQAGSLSGYADSSPYTITLSGASGNASTFTMTAASVPQKVCEKIRALQWSATNITSGECTEGNNTMTFLFNNDLSDNPSTPMTCKPWEKLIEGECTSSISPTLQNWFDTHMNPNQTIYLTDADLEGFDFDEFSDCVTQNPGYVDPEWCCWYIQKDDNRGYSREACML